MCVLWTLGVSSLSSPHPKHRSCNKGGGGGESINLFVRVDSLTLIHLRCDTEFLCENKRGGTNGGRRRPSVYEGDVEEAG